MIAGSTSWMSSAVGNAARTPANAWFTETLGTTDPIFSRTALTITVVGRRELDVKDLELVVDRPRVGEVGPRRRHDRRAAAATGAVTSRRAE